MLTGMEPGELADIVQTLVEGQAIMASSIYVDLVNLGLMQPDTAAARLRSIGAVAGSSLHRHPGVASQLQARLNRYADGVSETNPVTKPATPLRLIDGGRR